MSISLSDATLRLLDGKNYGVLATVNPDGSPQTSVVWVGRDGRDLLFSTVEGRVKHRNMLRDPRVSVSVIDSADPENYVELRGRVSMTPDIGRQLDTQLSWKYDGKDPKEDRPGAVRVVVRMAVEKVTGYAALAPDGRRRLTTDAEPHRVLLPRRSLAATASRPFGGSPP